MQKRLEIGSHVFIIYVHKGCLEAYQTADIWSELAEYMVEMEE